MDQVMSRRFARTVTLGVAAMCVMLSAATATGAEFLGGTDWNTPGNWSTGFVPNPLTSANVRLTGSDPTVRLSANGFCSSLFVGESDNVDTRAFKLDVVGAATIDGFNTDVLVQPGGEFEASAVVIRNQAEVYMTGGLMDANTVTVNSGTWLTGTGGPMTVDVQTRLTNNGTIRALNGATLTFTSTGGDVWDLDGSVGGNGVVQAVTGDINFASGSLTDAFDGTMTVGQGRALTLANSWTLGSSGLLTLNGGTTTATRARLAGGSVSASGGTIDVNGLAHIDAFVGFSGATVNVAATTDKLELNGNTSWSGGSFTGLGEIQQDGGVLVLGNVTIGVGTYDWDGGGSSETTVTEGRTFTLNVGKLDDANDTFNGMINLDGSMLDVSVADNSWDMAGTLNMNHTGTSTPEVKGDPMTVTGRLNVNYGYSVLRTHATFSNATLSIPDSFDALYANGGVTFNGGSYTGSGKLRLLGTSDVAADTTVDVILAAGPMGNMDVPAGVTLTLSNRTDYYGDTTWSGQGMVHQNGGLLVTANPVISVVTYDWDGNAGGTSVTTVNPGATLTLDVGTLDVGNDTFGGTINIQHSGALDVSVADGNWRMDGTLNMHSLGAGTPEVRGDEVTVTGTVNVSDGHAKFLADVDFQNATVSVPATNDALFLYGATTFNGGSYTGSGYIWFNGQADVIANTTIDASFRTGTAGSLAVSNGTTLQLNGYTSYYGTTCSGLGTIQQNGNVSVQATAEISVAIYDWDGVGESTVTTIREDDTLILDVGNLDATNDSFHGTINILPGGTLDVNVADNLWHMGGTLNLESTDTDEPVVKGDAVVITGTINVNDGVANVQSRVNFQNPTVSVPSHNDGLILEADTAFSGGSYTGGGRLRIEALASILADTTIDARFSVAPTGRVNVYDGVVLTLNGRTAHYGASTLGGLGMIRQNGDLAAYGDSVINVTTFDWDGNAGGGTVTTVTTSADLTIDVGTVDVGSDDFDGTINIESGGTLTVRVADNNWQMDGTLNMTGGTVNGDTMTVTGDVNSTVASTNTLNCNVDFQSGSTLDVATRAIFNGAQVFAPGSTVTLPGAQIDLNGPTTWAGPASITGTGALLQYGDATVTANTTIATRRYDMDGRTSGPSAITINPNVTFAVNVDRIDLSDDLYGGTLNLNGGILAVNNVANAWTMAGTLNLDSTVGTPTVNGDKMIVTGTVNVTGGTSTINAYADFQAPTLVATSGPDILDVLGGSTFRGGSYTGGGRINVGGVVGVDADTVIDLNFRANAGSAITVPAGLALTLNRNIEYFGGVHGGNGTIHANGRATAFADTAINVRTYNWDGAGAARTIVAAGKTLTLNVKNVNTGNDTFGGTLDIHGKADVNVDDGQWEMAGTMNLFGLTSLPVQIEGSDVHVSGTVNVTDNSVSKARMDILGTVNIQTAGRVFRVIAGPLADPNTIAGGVINGPGKLDFVTGYALVGNGAINADIAFAGTAELWADNGRLTVGGAILDVGTIGTADGDGVLDIVNPWNTGLANVVQLNGGVLTGAAVTNDPLASTRGHGRITTRDWINDGELAAVGGTLTIDTVNKPNLDGLSVVQGGISVVDGDLVVVPPLADEFDNPLVVGQTRTATFQNGWILGMQGTLDLNGGSVAPLRAMVNGGEQLLGGTVNVVGEGHFGAETTFLPSARVNLPSVNATLRLFDDTTIRTGATFVGDGTLVNVAPSTLTLENGATVGTKLRGAGTLEIGLGHGVARAAALRGVSMGAVSTFVADTGPGTLDKLVVPSGTAEIDPGATLAINVYGGGSEFKSGTYVLIDAAPGGAVAGQFTHVTDLNAYVSAGPDGNGLTYDAATVRLTLDLNLNPGDANLDGGTDVSDRIIWNNNNFKEGTTFQTGDFNNDGATDVSDRIIWNNNNFTEATAGPIAQPAPADSDGPLPVPEFIYDATTGLMTVNTNGHYLTEIVAPGPGEATPEGQNPRDPLLLPSSRLPEGLVMNGRGPTGFVLWGGEYFRGKFQGFDSVSNGLSGEFAVAQWAAGLGENDFGMVEWGSLPVPGQAGVGGLSPVTIVPEPATMVLLGLGGLVALARRRRRK